MPPAEVPTEGTRCHHMAFPYGGLQSALDPLQDRLYLLCQGACARPGRAVCGGVGASEAWSRPHSCSGVKPSPGPVCSAGVKHGAKACTLGIRMSQGLPGDGDGGEPGAAALLLLLMTRLGPLSLYRMPRFDAQGSRATSKRIGSA